MKRVVEIDYVFQGMLRTDTFEVKDGEKFNTKVMKGKRGRGYFVGEGVRVLYRKVERIYIREVEDDA